MGKEEQASAAGWQRPRLSKRKDNLVEANEKSRRVDAWSTVNLPEGKTGSEEEPRYKSEQDRGKELRKGLSSR